jgi:hypothetical protein
MEMTTDTFFRPDEVARESIKIPAALFNRCRLALNRCEYEHIFIPVRNMQYQAVIDQAEIIFVDNHAYAVRDGEGGRMIVLSWRFGKDGARDSLSEPVAIELVLYHPAARPIHQRLMVEFPKALEIMEARYREHGCEPRRRNIVAFPGGE